MMGRMSGLPAPVSAEILIDAPADAVFAAYADAVRWRDWDPDTRAAVWHGLFAQGTWGRLAPRTGLPVRMQITTLEPGRRFTVSCPVLGSRIHFDHEVDPLPGGTVRVLHRVRFEGWLAHWLSRKVGQPLRTGLPVTLAGLKRWVEGGPKHAASPR